MKKKLTALLLTAALLTTLAACGAKPAESTAVSSEPAATTESQPEVTEATEEKPEETPAPTEAPATTEAPEPEAADESAPTAGPQSVELSNFALGAKETFSFTTPDAGWYMKKSSNINLYNEESFDAIYSNSPVIQFCLKKDLDDIDRYKSDMENLTELPNRTIAGLDMAGRSYTMYGMDWTQYYAELPDGVWVTILSSGVSLEPGGEGSAILDSLEIS